jgi:hypothetical protein
LDAIDADFAAPFMLGCLNLKSACSRGSLFRLAGDKRAQA